MVGQAEDVYCTLVMSDSYLPGAAVLSHSLRDNGTNKKLAVLVTPDCLRANTITQLKSLYDHVIPVARIANPNPSNLYLMNRGDLLYAFTKINLWRQTQFRKIVYLDADTVSLRAPDELFDLDAPFAAAPDVGWPDAFNTGVMMLTPNMGDFWAMQTLASTGDSFDGADQGLLNQYFEHKNWHRLSFVYNCTPSANYQYEPAYRYNKARISMVHFIGKNKPWDADTSKSAARGPYNELLNRWWAVYDKHLKDTSSSSVEQPQVSATTTENAKEQQNGHESSEKKAFSAPQSEWDATRMAPPSSSQPEAANFPMQTYTFNLDKDFFQPPKAYPEPPKDMWYEVPTTKPNPPTVKPKPIFPWENRQDARPTRRFAEDLDYIDSNPLPGFTIPSADYTSSANSPIAPIITVTHEDPWQGFGEGSKNAWDDVQGIDSYIRALNASQTSRRRSSFQVVQSPPDTSERRESLILTDFPSEMDRPSLPVTPAPIHRPNFWAGERNDTLPAADGVPNQADWDPSEKLEELRRGSITMPLDLKMPGKKLPSRAMPSTAPAFYDKETAMPSTAVTSTNGSSFSRQGSVSSTSSTSTVTPHFNDPGFANGTKGEDMMSPTEHGSRDF